MRAFQKSRGEGATNDGDLEEIDLHALVVENLMRCIAEFKDIDRRNGGSGAFPYPESFAPANANENDSHLAAEWWLDKMMEPEGRSAGERYTRLSSTVGDVLGGAVYGYLSRVKAHLAIWLNMTPEDREFICTGVIRDGVAWRGDPPERYARLLEDAHEQRQDPAGYRARSAERRKQAYAKIQQRKPA